MATVMVNGMDVVEVAIIIYMIMETIHMVKAADPTLVVIEVEAAVYPNHNTQINLFATDEEWGNHWTKTCRTPKHLVDLYQESLKRI
ncbi:unnamed protein product [Arabidopsis halleri]